MSKWVKSFIGYQPRTSVKQEKEIWTPIVPVPLEVLESDITQGLSESFIHKGMFESRRYCYRDLEENVWGYVMRFEKEDDKMTLSLTYCINK